MSALPLWKVQTVPLIEPPEGKREEEAALPTGPPGPPPACRRAQTLPVKSEQAVRRRAEGGQGGEGGQGVQGVQGGEGGQGGVGGAGPAAGLLLHREAVRLAAGDFEAAQLFKYQLCRQDTKTKERSSERSKVKARMAASYPALAFITSSDRYLDQSGLFPHY